jgi:hypothetical protein
MASFSGRMASPTADGNFKAFWTVIPFATLGFGIPENGDLLSLAIYTPLKIHPMVQ